MNKKLDINNYMQKANVYLAQLTEAHQKSWGLGQHDSWSTDQEKGILQWSNEGKVVARSLFQIIGTYSLKSQSFLWAWDHPSVPESLSTDARYVLEFAQLNEVEFLQWRKLNCSVEDVWELAALAVVVNNRQGAFMGPAGDTQVFMTFGEVELLNHKE